jgi:hypothetical protein
MLARFRPRIRSVAALLLTAAGATASATESGQTALTPLMYGLAGDPLTEQSLLATRWALPTLSLRLDAAAGLGAHEVRILSEGASTWQMLRPSSVDSGSFSSWNIDPVRATYRYTLLADPSWQMKLGLSANLGGRNDLLLDPAVADGLHFGSLPMLHVAGFGQWSQRWRLAFALDGLATGRGRALDLGLQVNYLWSPSMSLYGGYQVTEAAGEAEAYYGAGLNNRANIGLRYRF